MTRQIEISITAHMDPGDASWFDDWNHPGVIDPAKLTVAIQSALDDMRPVDNQARSLPVRAEVKSIALREVWTP